MGRSGRWHEVASGILVFQDNAFDVNCGLILGDHAAALIDTTSSLLRGQQLLEAVRTVTQLPLEVVNTHSHFDHCFGNAAIPTTRIWGQRRGADEMDRKGSELRDRVVNGLRAEQPALADEVALTPLRAPTSLVDRSAILDLGGRSIELIHAGRGHTDHDLAIWIPDCLTLFVGDLIEESGPPAFEDSHPLDWPATVRSLLLLGPAVVVPGHGQPVASEFAERQLADLTAVASWITACLVPGAGREHPFWRGRLPCSTAAIALERISGGSIIEGD